MLELFPLPIFPTSSLSSSVIPVVWVGMFVVCFFNLRLGWALSGLVIPGYIVPLLLVKPWSAGVIFLESILTYFLVWWFSEYASRRAPWSNLFGRDRFFGIVLCSIFIRLLFDGWLLPMFGTWVNQTLQIQFDHHNHLHSFGLIIVALIANQFWKTGLVRGITPFAIILVMTLLIVRYILMELTNFNLSNVSYLYEDMAASILATPKAYIILISTALLASRMNLHYGWDFNGILIPSLMALQWYQPVKILATLVETGFILILAQLLLKTPMLNKMTIEGARKLLLFFNVSFAYKFMLGYALVAWLPEVKVTDYFGFGYLLSTLMAVKIHDKAILARLTRATLQTSLASVLFASIIGYALTLLPIASLFSTSIEEQKKQGDQIQYLTESLPALIKRAEVKFYQAKINDRFIPPQAHDIQVFTQAIKLTRQFLKDNNKQTLNQAASYFWQVNYTLDVVRDRYLLIHEKMPVSGWGVYVFDMKQTSSLAISVPDPLNERGIIDASISLFKTLNAGSLAISGSSRQASADQSGDVLHNKQTFFHQFHRQVSRHNSLQIRGFNTSLARQIAGYRRIESEFDISGVDTTIWAKKSLPADLDLVQLKKLFSSYKIAWNPPPFENQQRNASSHGFAELILTKQAIRQAMFKPLLIKQNINYLQRNESIEGYFKKWILDSKKKIAAKGSELYQKPELDELLFLDDQIITPLLKLVNRYSVEKGWTSDNQTDLQFISYAANAVGFQVIRYRNIGTDEQFLILTEQDKERLRHWGTYVFRLGEAENFIVQTPRPIYELNSFEFGVSFFERLSAKILMIGTTHPHANQDGSADLIAPSNIINLFNLVNQVILRENKSLEMLAISCRAFSYREDQPVVDADIMLSLAQGIIEPTQLKSLEQQLFTTLENDGLSVQWVNGSEATRGYEISSASTTHYLKATKNKNFATLWLSPLAREGYKQQDLNSWETAQFNILDIATIEQGLIPYIEETRFSPNSENLSAIRSLLFDYLDNPDILRLQQMVLLPKASQFLFKRLIDISSKQAFLLIHNNRGKLLAVSNLHPRNRTVEFIDPNKNLAHQSQQFIDVRSAWLEPKDQ